MSSGSIKKINIVVVAYNRLNSLKRLMQSLLKAEYLNDKVDLIISVDSCGDSHIVDYAKTIVWPYGDLEVIAHPKRLGLKTHVLRCGDLTEIYENIIVLEDDLYVSPGFYSYAKQTLEAYAGNNDIAGISLYSHKWNPYVDRPFTAIKDAYDIYFMQVASSWGQVWAKSMWREFMIWIKDKTDDDLHSNLMPEVVSNWSNKSWLKYHNKYLVDNNKYFIYPHYSLSTNFSEVGEHANLSTTYQVELLQAIRMHYRLPLNIYDSVIYDAFFENLSIAGKLSIDPSEIDIDLYGARDAKKRYLLTTKKQNYRQLNSFGLKLRPIEMNVIDNIGGEGIYLYDTKFEEKRRKGKALARIRLFIYEVRATNKFLYLYSALFLYGKSIIRRLVKK